MLSLSAESGPALKVPGWVGWALLLACLGFGMLLLVGRTSRVLSLVSGLAFAVVGLASRLVDIPQHEVWGMIADPMAWALILGGNHRRGGLRHGLG